jgi:RNA polymerase sigma-70 factor (ECF subfamily)
VLTSLAFEQLLDRYERQVYATALRMLGRREDAQDAAQEVFLRLYRHMGRIEAAAVSPWLYRVTVNVCRDALRKRMVQPAQWPEVDFDPADPGAGPDAAAGLGERKRMVAAALERLSPKERAAVLLRDLEGLSTRDVARALGSAEVTVRSQLSKARRKIKDMIDGLQKIATMDRAAR